MKKGMLKAFGALLLLSLITSCAAAGAPDAEASVPAVNTAAEMTAETEPSGPVFPEVNYNGEEIRFLTEDWAYGDIYDSVEIFTEGLDGSLINDAVYMRNLQVEERFNVRITEERLESASKKAYSAVMAGDNQYDIVMPYLNSSTANAKQGLYLDLAQIENLKLENSWWDQNANDTLRVNNKLYFTTGDISILDNDCMLVLFFNKPLIKDFSLDSPYDLVKDGAWTLDKLFEMGGTVISDLNGDGAMTANEDRWGVYIFPNTPLAMFFASGERIISPDENGKPRLVMYNERSAEAIDRIMTYCLDQRNMSGGYIESEVALCNDRLLFGAWALTEINSLRDSKSDFGVLPFPKYNAEQPRYHCIISTGLTPGVSVPITNDDPAKAGLILEAMAYYSVDTLTHAYYDVALNDRYIRDEESSEMLDIMFASSVYDFGYIYDIGGLGMLLENMYNSKSNSFSSRYTKLESKALAELDTIFESFGVFDS